MLAGFPPEQWTLSRRNRGRIRPEYAPNRSKSFLAAQAIEEFLALQEWQVAAIKEGIDAADRGELVSHDEAVAELSRWGKSHAD